jgi:epoxyqueuosine reductase
LKAKLLQQIEQREYAVRVASIEHARELRESIETNHHNGVFDETLYKEYLSGFVYSPPESLPEARSLIVVAVRQPQVRFTFTWKGERTPIIVPPSYLHMRETDLKVQESLAEVLGTEGYQVVPAVLPKKLLAVRSGLAMYGRNNITFVAGMGSFHRLNAFYSDMPCDGEEDWQDLRMMEQCNDCGACISQCPTGAISPERFLLHAERCIVFHNEKPRDIPFPSWLDPSWHNSLVGCMHCQRICPENKPYLKFIEEGPEFSSDETALLMAGTPQDQLPATMVKKLEECDLLSMMDAFPRNLKVLLEQV